MLQIDYVTTFAVDADDSIGSPPHWLYMSLGFSDLYGDGRLFAPIPNDGVSCHSTVFWHCLQCFCCTLHSRVHPGVSLPEPEIQAVATKVGLVSR